MNTSDKQAIRLAMASHGKWKGKELTKVMDILAELVHQIIDQSAELGKKDPEDMANESAENLVEAAVKIFEALA